MSTVIRPRHMTSSLPAFTYVLTNPLNGNSLGASLQNIINEITRSCKERETIGIKKGGYATMCYALILMYCE